jgi:hypothetical protein
MDGFQTVNKESPNRPNWKVELPSYLYSTISLPVVVLSKSRPTSYRVYDCIIYTSMISRP